MQEQFTIIPCCMDLPAGPKSKEFGLCRQIELVRAAGYSERQKDGNERPELHGLLRSVLEAKGVIPWHNGGAGVGPGLGQASATSQVAVQRHLRWQALHACWGSSPAIEFEIQLGKKQIRLLLLDLK